MTRTTKHRIAWTSAACAFALAAAFGASGRDAAPPPASSFSLVETLTLLRWGEGALDWTLPDANDTQGDADARIRNHRA